MRPTQTILALLSFASCSREPSTHGSAAPVAAVSPPATAVPPPSQPIPHAPEPTPRQVGCWEREFGSPPAPEGLRPSLPGPIDGCAGCEDLRVGPKAVGLHPQVLTRVHKIIAELPPAPVPEPVLWINSGSRSGDADQSMHNQALAIDAVICGLDTRATGKRLREAGFTCVIEYFDIDGNPCHFAHADLRGTQWAAGAYAKGGRKARTCPKKATSRTQSCANGSKRDWTYSEG